MHRRCHARFVSPRCIPGFVLRDPAERVVGRVKVILAMMNVSIHRKADQSVIGAHGTGREMRRRGDELLVRMAKFFRGGQAATLAPTLWCILPAFAVSFSSSCPYYSQTSDGSGRGRGGLEAFVQLTLYGMIVLFQQHDIQYEKLPDGPLFSNKLTS